MAAVTTASGYDIYADTRSQVYGGIEAETPSVDAAVDATARRVLLYRGKVITAYYSSSSGGRTVSAAEAFGTPVPYLVSVADPYDTVSPNHDWGPVLFDARKVAKALKVKGGLLDLRATDGPSGHVATVTATGPHGEVGRDRHRHPHAARAALDVVLRSAGSRSTRRGRRPDYGVLAPS